MTALAQNLPAPPNMPAGPISPGAVEQLPHGIRGLLPYAMSWLDLLMWVLIALAIIAVIWLLWRWWDKREKKEKIENIDYYALALAKVRKMQPPEPFHGKNQEDYFYNLSLTLRECIEIRTRIHATDLTFNELKSPLRNKLPLKTEEIESVLKFLERADMVKFAGMESSIDEAKGFWDDSVSWASKMKPREDEIKQFGDNENEEATDGIR